MTKCAARYNLDALAATLLYHVYFHPERAWPSVPVCGCYSIWRHNIDRCECYISLNISEGFLTTLSFGSFNVFLAIRATRLLQADLSPQRPQAPNGRPLDTHRVLEVWVHQQHHMVFVLGNNAQLVPLVVIADEAAGYSGRLHSIF